jgi:hypothetical protein
LRRITKEKHNGIRKSNDRRQMEDQITAEQIAQHYSAAMDSVNLINAGQPEGMSDEDWADCVSRNVEHLKIMVAKDFWTDEDLTPFNEAIGA